MSRLRATTVLYSLGLLLALPTWVVGSIYLAFAGVFALAAAS